MMAGKKLTFENQASGCGNLAGPPGFEPGSPASKARRMIQTTLRARWEVAERFPPAPREVMRAFNCIYWTVRRPSHAGTSIFSFFYGQRVHILYLRDVIQIGLEDHRW